MALGWGSSATGVREGAAEVRRVPRRGGEEPSTLLQHRCATSMEASGSRSCSMDLARVGERPGRWCATAGDEERGRGKDGRRK